MTLTFIGSASAVSGSAPTITHPSGIASGDLIVLFSNNNSGSGSQSVNAGKSMVKLGQEGSTAVFTRQADGTESGNTTQIGTSGGGSGRKLVEAVFRPNGGSWYDHRWRYTASLTLPSIPNNVLAASPMLVAGWVVSSPSSPAVDASLNHVITETSGTALMVGYGVLNGEESASLTATGGTAVDSMLVSFHDFAPPYALEALSPYDTIVLNDSPTLYLPLNDTTGTTAVSLAGPNGTYNNSPTLDQTGPTTFDRPAKAMEHVSGSEVDLDYTSGTALDFDGQYSVECWFKASGVGISDQIAAFDDTDLTDSACRRFQLRFETASGDIKFITLNGNSNTAITTSTGWDDDQWHHIVASVDSTPEATIYIDGELEAGPTACQSVNAALFNSHGGIGARYSGGSFSENLPTGCRQAGFALYTGTVLTAAQVKNHYYVGQALWREGGSAAAMVMG